MTEKNFLKRLLKLLKPKNIPLFDGTNEELTISENPHMAAGWWEGINKGASTLSFAYQKLDKCYGLYEDVIAFNVAFRCVPFATTIPIYDERGKLVGIKDTPAQKLFDKAVIKIVKEEIEKRLSEIEKGERE